MEPFRIVPGIAAEHARAAVELYYEAFCAKLSGLLGPDARALAFLENVLNRDHAISAVSEDAGHLLGIAGYKTAQGAMIDGDLRDLLKHYGVFGGLWRAPVLAIVERPIEPKRLLMDGIAVVPEARGLGVGSALLDAIAEEALRREKSEIRLDVIDRNARARALYERKGYIAGNTEHLGPLRHVFGFEHATTMIKPVSMPET